MATKESKDLTEETAEAQAEETPEASENMEGEPEEAAGEVKVIASARHLPRPATILATPGVGDITGFKASLVADMSGPTVEEIREVNMEHGGDTRTPLMTVIQAVIRDRGGSVPLLDLCTAAKELWNRPLSHESVHPRRVHLCDGKQF